MDQSILTTLRKIHDAGESVKFFNTYHGIPVSFHGKILRMVGARVLFDVLTIQIFCMLGNRGTFIKHKMLPGVLQAKVADFDLVKGNVELWNFEITEETIGLRAEVRVAPAESVMAICRLGEEKKIRVTIEDISLHGLSFHVDKDTFEENQLDDDQKLTIFYALEVPLEEKPRSMIQYDARIRNINFRKDNSFPPKEYYRIGLRSEPDKNNEKLLTRFVAYRQKQIIAELKEKCGEELLI
jgi:hypothetical protein